MDLFVIVFCLLMCCWSIIYAYKNISILTKYKIALINFTLTGVVILLIHNFSADLWKYSLIRWIFIPNIVAGSLVPILLLIVYALWQNFNNQKN
ncbi:MAG: hypothetical protein ACRCW2_07660 [Cellulosilyticaceae bacterium]